MSIKETLSCANGIKSVAIFLLMSSFCLSEVSAGWLAGLFRGGASNRLGRGAPSAARRAALERKVQELKEIWQEKGVKQMLAKRNAERAQRENDPQIGVYRQRLEEATAESNLAKQEVRKAENELQIESIIALNPNDA